jgi:hypothetical protein
LLGLVAIILLALGLIFFFIGQRRRPLPMPTPPEQYSRSDIANTGFHHVSQPIDNARQPYSNDTIQPSPQTQPSKDSDDGPPLIWGN